MYLNESHSHLTVSVSPALTPSLDLTQAQHMEFLGISAATESRIYACHITASWESRGTQDSCGSDGATAWLSASCVHIQFYLDESVTLRIPCKNGLKHTQTYLVALTVTYILIRLLPEFTTLVKRTHTHTFDVPTPLPSCPENQILSLPDFPELQLQLDLLQ